MYTLGINAAFHDPAAVIVKDGVVLAAAEEERFTHIKHGKRPVPFSTWELPYNAIDFCLKTAGISLAEVDHIGYSFDPLPLLGDRANALTVEIPLRPEGVRAGIRGFANPYEGLFLASILNAPGHLADGVPLHLSKRFGDLTPEAVGAKWQFINHHLAHAASAFLPSPHTNAAVLVLDGRGEQVSTSYWRGQGNQMELLGEVALPHSLGLMYEQMTTYLGFLHSSDEYKVMALASFGQPVYADYFRSLIHVGPDGQYTIAPLNLEQRFGPPRAKGGPLEARHFDIAHSVQTVLEETVLQLLNWLHQRTGCDAVCLAGGVALNCVMNARLRDRGPFGHIWVQPAAGDSGTALGAAMWIDAQQRQLNTTQTTGPAPDERAYEMEHAYLGPAYSDADIERFLQWSKLPYRRLGNVAEEVAGYLAEGHIIGWMQQGMEFGPRALGARSILAPPFPAEMQGRLNDLKDREDFRPVAPVVLEEFADAYFINARKSPFMLFVNEVKAEKKHEIPAVTHTDGTARIQTVNERQNKPYYALLKAFHALTGVPILVNTSFNTQGEPVVCSPRDAVESFWTSPLDALVIGSFMLEKTNERGAGSWSLSSEAGSKEFQPLFG